MDSDIKLALERALLDVARAGVPLDSVRNAAEGLYDQVLAGLPHSDARSDFTMGVLVGWKASEDGREGQDG